MDVLIAFVDDAIKKCNFQRPIITVKSTGGDDDADHSGEDNDIEDNGEEDNNIEMNFEDSYTFIDDNAINDINTARKMSVEFAADERPKAMLTSSTDTSAWKLEVERVLPQLKVILHGVRW